MAEPLKHVVVDTNVIVNYLCPKACDDSQTQDRCKCLLSSVVEECWDGIRVYAPLVCVVEALGVLDKYRFCRWSGPVKQDSTKRLSDSDYQSARRTLLHAVEQRRIERLSYESGHALLSGFVSPINQHYQYRRKSKAGATRNRRVVKKPMGGADCLIAGMAIHLGAQLGAENVALVTCDQRLADILKKAKSLSPESAKRLGMDKVAEQAKVVWSPDIYPESVNLHRCDESSLVDSFGGWPLPTKRPKKRRRDQLDASDAAVLEQVWLRVATLCSMTNPDNLPYSDALQRIRVDFATEAGTQLSSKDVCDYLIGQRKRKLLRKPGDQEAGEASASTAR